MAKIILNGGDWQFKGFVGEDWLLRSSHLPGTRDVRGWHAASVPGSVQHDLWQAGLTPDPYFEMNSLALEWVPDRTWVYKKTFRADPALRDQRIQLVFDGVDYSARFFLNGELLGQNTGMFLPAAFDVSECLDYEGDNLLAVVIAPAPFEQPQIGYTSQVSTQKSRMNYWWDFCPRMVHLGIWQEVCLRVSGLARIADVFIQPKLSVDLLRAEVIVSVQLEKPADAVTTLQLRLLREGDDNVVQSIGGSVAAGQSEGQFSFRIDQPSLWWPNGTGDQPLYVVEVDALVNDQVSDSRREPFGIRRIEFVTNDGAPDDSLPYNLVVNGRKIYIQGWNWVPMDVLYGVPQPEKRERLMRLAAGANVNLLRVWGGGLIETEEFYDLCDRLGILVWQEFIQSSSGIDNFPSEDPKFIQFLLQNAERAVRTRRNHASLAVWCGGNELHNAPNHLCDDTHPALAALSSLVKRMDPDRHWVPTSPVGGVFAYDIPKNEEDARRMQDVHGPWEFQGVRQQMTLYNQGRSLLHSEFGVEGLTNLRTLNRTIAPEHQAPVSLTNPVWEHLASWWVKEPVWQAAFGAMPDVAAVQRATQFMQAEGLRYAVEADRRRMYANGGTMPWQFNEPYPMAACTSAVDYYAEPKPAYYAMARAYQGLSLTARFSTLAWQGEAALDAEVWCANAGAQQDGSLTAQVIGLDGQVFDKVTAQVKCPQNAAQLLARVTTPLRQINTELFFLDITLQNDQGGQTGSNRYLFTMAENLAPLLGSLPDAWITAQIEKSAARWVVTVENPSSSAALWVWLEADKPDLRALSYAYFSDNYFCLLPGEKRIIQVDWTATVDSDRAIQVTGWNFPALRLN